LLALNLLAIVLVHRIGRALADETMGLVAAAAYAVLSIGPAVLGFTANAEHFVLVPALAGLLLLVRPRTNGGPGVLVVAGLLEGTAYVMKQPGGAFVVAGAVISAVAAGDARRAMSRVAVFTTAAVVPFAATCALMWALGAFTPFWFWTVTYAREYVSEVPVAAGLAHGARVASTIGTSAPAFWLLAAVGATTPAWDATARRAAAALVPFAVGSVLAVCPGLRFSEHYFILLLPAASLLIGLAVTAVARRAGTGAGSLPAAVSIGLTLVAAGNAIATERAVLLELSPDGVARAVFGTNPFPEAPAIARRLAERSASTETIGVIGSEPEIYFYARRPAATSYIYMYPLMEPHPFARRMQDEMIAQLERARPKFLVLVSVDTSWTRRPASSTAIFDWAARTVAERYDQIGLVEIPRDAPAVYRWDADARTVPTTASFVTIFARR
jgi:hypothetical protein